MAEAEPHAPPGKYMSPVKVGPKGQIVIPKEVRDMFGITPGETLILLADVERGIAIQKFALFEKYASEAFDARGLSGKETE